MVVVRLLRIPLAVCVGENHFIQPRGIADRAEMRGVVGADVNCLDRDFFDRNTAAVHVDEHTHFVFISLALDFGEEGD